MLTPKPFQFTSENQASIPIYCRKWQEIACSTRPLARESVSLVINQAYEFLELSHPQIIFINDPREALDYIYREVTLHWGKLDRSSLGNAIASQFVYKLLDNIRNSENESIIERLGINLDEDLAKSKAKIIANDIQPSLATSLFFANTLSIMDSTFAADPSLSGIPKVVIKLFLDILVSGSFLQSQYLASFQWQIFSKLTSLIAQDKSQEMYDAFKDLGTDIFAGKANRKKGGEYQLPTIEFSAAIINVFVPSVMADYAYYIDFCHQVLGYDRNSQKWEIFYDLITTCGWIFPYEKTVLVCDR